MATTPMTAPMPAPEAEPQAKISPFGRIVGVLFSPRATYQDIARKPSWLLPIVVTTIMSIIATSALNQRMDWGDFTRQQMDKSASTANLSPEAKEKRVEASAKLTPIIVYITGLLVPILAALVLSVVMMGAYNLLAGAGATFSQAFSIAAHAGLVGIVSTPIFLLILFLKPPGTIEVENPMATNIAAFLPEESAKWLVAMCKSFDIFTFWTLILLAFGFAAVNPRKLKGAKAFTIAFSVWAVYVVLKTGWAFIFS